MKKIESRSGYTLIEMMLYMVIAILVITVAFSMVGRTQTQYGQQKSMSKLQGNGRNAIYILANDIRNMGFKHYISDHTTDDLFEVFDITGVTTGEDTITTDSLDKGDNAKSSFYYFNNNTAFDSLEFFKGEVVIGNGSDSLMIKRVIRVKYYVENNTLYRRFKQLDNQTGPKHWSSDSTTTIAENVEAFKLEYSDDKVSFTPIPGNKGKVKAIRIYLLLRTNRTVPVKTAGEYRTVAGVNVPVGGRFLRRLYTETVEVVNNGI